jgi:adenylosuccinate lyase
VKELTRGRQVTLADLHELLADLDVPADVREELTALTPAGYTGLAAALVDDLDAER